MPDTTNRPTPKELGDQITSRYAGPTDATDVLLAALAANGYVIVHPDDVPVAEGSRPGLTEAQGWNACRAHIFGDTQ